MSHGFWDLIVKSKKIPQPRLNKINRLSLLPLKIISSLLVILSFFIIFEPEFLLRNTFTCKLFSIHDNMKNLMVPFQKKHYVTPSMQGSYSIKYVLPALVPQMQEAYKKLEGIQNEGQAMNAFSSLHVKSLEEQKVIRKQLLAYCELDTLAMVNVLGKLRKEYK